ncbi:hypothetical protein J4G07_05155, partial [Candidatus Poribacteria bacterium]|nr:hypothetical protein [Candidatus Poribacteria bacterium]
KGLPLQGKSLQPNLQYYQTQLDTALEPDEQSPPLLPPLSTQPIIISTIMSEQNQILFITFFIASMFSSKKYVINFSPL